MTIEKILRYIFHTPLNTNKTILTEMLEDLIISHGGSLDGSTPDNPGEDIIYDGGMEAWGVANENNYR